MTNRDFSEPRFSKGAEKILESRRRTDSSNVWDRLIC